MKIPNQYPPIFQSDYYSSESQHESINMQKGATCAAGYKPIKHGPCPKSAKKSCKTIRQGSNVSCCCPK